MAEWWASLWSVTWTHWLVLCLILLALVAATHIFDFLWLAVASAIVMGLVYALPDSSLTLQNTVFFISTIALIPLGRLWAKRFQREESTHPDLNNRSAQMIGQRGTALGDFQNGLGRLKAGDSQWQARCDETQPITDGTELEIIEADGTLLIVRPWQG